MGTFGWPAILQVLHLWNSKILEMPKIRSEVSTEPEFVGKEFKSKCPLDNNEVEDVAVVAEVVVGIADPSVVVVEIVVAVDAEAAPEAVAGNVVVPDVLPLIDQCRGVAVGQLPHLKDAEVNLNTLVSFLLACQVHSLMFEL